MHKPEHVIQQGNQSLMMPHIQTVKSLISLTKPTAVAMIVLVTAAGFTLAVITEQGSLSHYMIKLFFTCLLVGCSSGGAFALNQYLERHIDAKMPRVSNRALPSGRLKPLTALIFGLTFLIVPILMLGVLVTPMCALLTFLCGSLYVWAYTPLKTRSSMSTFVGAIPGALLPLMGWVAVSNQLNLIILYPVALLFVWQAPHALVIAIKYKDDYSRAGMKQLPLIAGTETGYRAIFFSTFLTGILSFFPVFWATSYKLFFIITFCLLLAGTFLAALMWIEKSAKFLNLYFSFNLISLPIYLLLFISSL